jgi:hypothetical protein
VAEPCLCNQQETCMWILKSVSFAEETAITKGKDSQGQASLNMVPYSFVKDVLCSGWICSIQKNNKTHQLFKDEYVKESIFMHTSVLYTECTI